MTANSSLTSMLKTFVKKARKKINALARLVNYIDLSKDLHLMLSLIISLLLECLADVHLTTKLTGYMNVV